MGACSRAHRVGFAQFAAKRVGAAQIIFQVRGRQELCKSNRKIGARMCASGRKHNPGECGRVWSAVTCRRFGCRGEEADTSPHFMDRRQSCRAEKSGTSRRGWRTIEGRDEGSTTTPARSNCAPRTRTRNAGASWECGAPAPHIVSRRRRHPRDCTLQPCFVVRRGAGTHSIFGPSALNVRRGDCTKTKKAPSETEGAFLC
jgi:hypothetical protein